MVKAFLSTLKGKIIAGISGGAVVIAGIVGALMITSGPEDYRTIKIQELNGSTTIASNDVSVQEAYKGMNLKSGDVVTVQNDANMTLLLDMDKYMFADEGTKFRVEASGNSDKSNTKTRIVLEEGSVLCRLDTKLGDEETFEVETPNSVMSVRGTIFKMTIYKDENGENYVRVDVLEGAVKVDLYNENGEKTGEEGLVEAGKAATVHSNPDLSEFVIGDSDISYEDFSEEMATFVVNVIDDGREICIGSDLFKHYTGLENHPETKTVVKEATCAEEGAQDVYCDVCKMVVRTEPIEKVEHELERKTTETKNGCNIHILVQDVCKNCNMAKEVSVEDEVKHTYSDWKIVKNVSCSSAGERQMVCSGCNDTISESIAATGHSYGSYSTVEEATCTVAGLKEKTCSGCGDKQSETIAATGHSYGSWTTVVAATCEEKGSESRSCSGCGNQETQQIAALGHDAYHDPTVMHLVENYSSGAVVGEKVEIFAYFSCNRCQAEVIPHMTGTVTKNNDDGGYTPNFTCDICGANG